MGAALSFEFVNGFHDTANAVSTVIYTHTLKPTPAVVWSGIWNLIGVLTLPVCTFLGALLFALILNGAALIGLRWRQRLVFLGLGGEKKAFRDQLLEGRAHSD